MLEQLAGCRCLGRPGSAAADSQRPKQAEVDQDFTDETIERRQPADGDRADQEAEGRAGHRPVDS